MSMLLLLKSARIRVVYLLADLFLSRFCSIVCFVCFPLFVCFCFVCLLFALFVCFLLCLFAFALFVCLVGWLVG
jgi:hypothetical protein